MAAPGLSLSGTPQAAGWMSSRTMAPGSPSQGPASTSRGRDEAEPVGASVLLACRARVAGSEPASGQHLGLWAPRLCVLGSPPHSCRVSQDWPGIHTHPGGCTWIPRAGGSRERPSVHTPVSDLWEGPLLSSVMAFRVGKTQLSLTSHLSALLSRGRVWLAPCTPRQAWGRPRTF